MPKCLINPALGVTGNPEAGDVHQTSGINCGTLLKTSIHPTLFRQIKTASLAFHHTKLRYVSTSPVPILTDDLIS